MGLYPSLCLVNASCDQVRQILKKTLSKKISVSVLMKILVSSLSAFKDTDIVLWFQNISHYNDGTEVVAVAARDIKEGEEVKSSSQTSRTNISALQIELDQPSHHLLTLSPPASSPLWKGLWQLLPLLLGHVQRGKKSLAERPLLVSLPGGSNRSH